jgi:hypothetical protein
MQEILRTHTQLTLLSRKRKVGDEFCKETEKANTAKTRRNDLP